MRRALLLLVLSACGVNLGPDSVWPAAEPHPATAQAHFVVTDNLSDQLSFVSADPAAPRSLGQVPVGNVAAELEGPHHIAASPDGRFLYVNLSNYVPGAGSGPHGAHGTGSVPGSVLKLSAKTFQKVAEVQVDRNPGDVILSPDGTTAYVSHYDLLRLQDQLLKGAPEESGYASLAIVDTATMTKLQMFPVCATAHGLGISSDAKTLYVSCALSDELVVVDVSRAGSAQVTTRLKVGPNPGSLGMPNYGPYALSVHPTDGTVWISNNNSGEVRVFVPQSGAIDEARTVFVGGVAMFGQFSADGSKLYVPHQGDDLLSEIDVATRVKRDLAFPANACKNAHAFVRNPTGPTGIVVCEGDHTLPGTVVTVNTAAFAVIGAVPVGVFPDGAVFMAAP